MEPMFTFRNIEATEGLKTHMLAKLHKLNKYHLDIISTHVILSIERNDHCAEITLINHGDPIIAQASSSDMYVSIDEAIKKLEGQLRRHKDRVRHHKGGEHVRDHIE